MVAAVICRLSFANIVFCRFYNDMTGLDDQKPSSSICEDKSNSRQEIEKRNQNDSGFAIDLRPTAAMCEVYGFNRRGSPEKTETSAQQKAPTVVHAYG